MNAGQAPAAEPQHVMVREKRLSDRTAVDDLSARTQQDRPDPHGFHRVLVEKALGFEALERRRDTKPLPQVRHQLGEQLHVFLAEWASIRRSANVQESVEFAWNDEPDQQHVIKAITTK